MTLEVVEKVRFDSAFMFIFSSRPGTRAAEMIDKFVPQEIIQERFDRLVQVQDRVSYERNTEEVGQTMEVLSEGPSRKRDDVATTRSRTGKLVHVAGSHPSGLFLDVVVTEAKPHYLVGSPV